MNQFVFIACLPAALLTSYAWVTTGSTVAGVPGALGVVFGTGAVVLERRYRNSTARAVFGFTLVASVVAILVQFADEDALFFGTLSTWSILAAAGALYAAGRDGG